MTRYRNKITIGMLILLLMVYSYVTSLDALFFTDFVRFLRWIDLPEGGWLILDKYFYNGAL